MKPDYFFEESKVFWSVTQDCSVTEFNTLQQACAIRPICVLKPKSRYENVTYNGRKEQWSRGGCYALFSNSGSEVDEIPVANWFIKDMNCMEGGGRVSYRLVDPYGKTVFQYMEGKLIKEIIANIFIKIREISNYESILNYELREENKRLKQEIDNLKSGIKLSK